ncbi:regulatory protein RecX [Flavobacterium sp. UMI-01]|uniref:regulatory protein RecX n=1 Tax=Flavobacterium sp. UMI-01 TaxID=1441053 RepID=UPI001C7D6B1C|nr:regulatory protein RecX [Flavobacterium sp. UMI-01]GIZ09927.1 recombinase RecX [Flavobacterium sp. UMI-01]
MKDFYTIKEALRKIEQYCAYQDRCHEEVMAKLREMKMDTNEIEQIIAQLIADNFLNEERFARSFARGKHRIKHWGKNRIVNELKLRKINQTLINLALNEISPEEYEENFNTFTFKHWNSLTETNQMKKRKKFCDYFLRRGFESFLIYDRMKELENL